MRILCAEGEPALAIAIQELLIHAKYTVDITTTGPDALDYALARHYDCVILDQTLPGLDGLAVLQRMREHEIAVPVLLLTAQHSIEDRIQGLDAGADDCLTKPFSMKELLARIRALLRRRDAFIPDQLMLGNVTLDQKQALLRCGGQAVPLSRLEYQIMELLMRHPGVAFSASCLFEEIWGMDTDAEIGVVWVYISYLRKKLEKLPANIAIRAKRNIGYFLEIVS